MQKITMIIGEPCVGKSTLMRKIMGLGMWKYDGTTKYVPCHWSQPNRCILGRYDEPDHKFPGTDRMSMACQSRVIEFIKRNPGVNFLFEGDRLGNEKMVRALKELGINLLVIHVRVDDRVLAERRAAERQDQNEKFVRSRVTKIRNLRAAIKSMGVVIRNVDLTNRNGAYDAANYIVANRL